MNKNQLRVAWMMGVIISLSAVDFYLDRFLSTAIPTLIIGGLLIYTVRDKKKEDD